MFTQKDVEEIALHCWMGLYTPMIEAAIASCLEWTLDTLAEGLADSPQSYEDATSAETYKQHLKSIILAKVTKEQEAHLKGDASI